jgi:hypothetical protein
MQNPVTSGAPSGAADTTRFDLLELIARVQAWHWIAASVLILLVDYMTGPFIQFPILFVVPVAIATAAQGVMAGSIVAVLLPLLRLSFFLKWELPSSWLLEGVDTGVERRHPGRICGVAPPDASAASSDQSARGNVPDLQLLQTDPRREGAVATAGGLHHGALGRSIQPYLLRAVQQDPLSGYG